MIGMDTVDLWLREEWKRYLDALDGVLDRMLALYGSIVVISEVRSFMARDDVGWPYELLLTCAGRT